jgi:hypothetical protein
MAARGFLSVAVLRKERVRMAASRFSAQNELRRQSLVVALARLYQEEDERVVASMTQALGPGHVHRGSDAKTVHALVAKYSEKLEVGIYSDSRRADVSLCCVTSSFGTTYSCVSMCLVFLYSQLLRASFDEFRSYVPDTASAYAIVVLLCGLSKSSRIMSSVAAAHEPPEEGPISAPGDADSCALNPDLQEWELSYIASLATMSGSDASESDSDATSAAPSSTPPAASTASTDVNSGSPRQLLSSSTATWLGTHPAPRTSVSWVQALEDGGEQDFAIESFVVDQVVAVLCGFRSDLICESKGTADGVHKPECRCFANLSSNALGNCSVNVQHTSLELSLEPLLYLCTSYRKVSIFVEVFSSHAGSCRSLESFLGAVRVVLRRHQRFLLSKQSGLSMAGALTWLQPVANDVALLLRLISELLRGSEGQTVHSCTGATCQSVVHIPTWVVQDVLFEAWRVESALWNPMKPSKSNIGLVLGLFWVCLRTYLDMVDDFVYAGRLPHETQVHDTFFVSLDASLSSGTLQYWNEAYAAVDRCVPSFLRLPATPKRDRTLADCILLCGKSAALLANVVQRPRDRLDLSSSHGTLFKKFVSEWIKLSSPQKDVSGIRGGALQLNSAYNILEVAMALATDAMAPHSVSVQRATNMLHVWPAVFMRCLSAPIVSRLPFVALQISGILSGECLLREKFAALQEFFLAGGTCSFDQFSRRVFSILRATPCDRWASQLDGAALMSIMEFYLPGNTMDHVREHISISVTLPALPHSDDPLFFLGHVHIVYTPQWPLSLVLSGRAMLHYLSIWRFLMTIKCAKCHLLACSPVWRARGGGRANWHSFDILRFKMQSFWVRLEQAVVGHIESAKRTAVRFEKWDALAVAANATIVDVYRAEHEAFAALLHDGLLLSGDMSAGMSVIEDLCRLCNAMLALHVRWVEGGVELALHRDLFDTHAQFNELTAVFSRTMQDASHTSLQY